MPRQPSFTPRKQGARVGPILLPAGGREGDPPPWPFTTTEPGEVEAWAALWKRPQAVAWELMGCERIVARYCRLMVACEKPPPKPALFAQASVLEDRLGLTPKAMRALLWQVAEDEVAIRREATGKARSGRPRAVDGGAS